ncbi:MAG: hypothetical protein ACKVZJ_08900 [Phycisphaerales bacterium]
MSGPHSTNDTDSNEPGIMSPARSPTAGRSRTGRYVALGMVVLWVAVVVGLYVVIVKLKLGGAAALREAPAAPASEPHRTR